MTIFANSSGLRGGDASVELLCQNVFRSARFALFQAFAHTNDGPQPELQGGLRLANDIGLGLAEVPPPLTVRGREPELLSGLESLAGEGPVNGFVLDLRKIWEPLPKSLRQREGKSTLADDTDTYCLPSTEEPIGDDGMLAPAPHNSSPVSHRGGAPVHLRPVEDAA
jgi:hypothetical protein